MQFTKKHLFLIIAMFCISPVFGQKKQTAVKLSANLFRGGTAKNPDFKNEIDQSPTALFSAGVLFFNNKKSFYQEIGISRFSNTKEKIGFKEMSETVLGAKYEYGRLGKQLNGHFNLRYGGSLELFYGKDDFIPSTTQSFPSEQKIFGVMLAFSPHLDIALSKRFFIDLNPSLVLLTFYFEKEQNQNPTLPLRQQKQSGFGLDAGGVLLQVGVGYKL